MDNEEKIVQRLEAEDRAAEEAESTALIAITTLPEIKENLRSLRDRWEQEARDAASLVCTEESVQCIKKARADMRKEYEDADTQRKAVKAQYLAAWNEVEATWKECVAEPFKRADASYKDTIGSFEGQLKAECKDRLREYFAELCSLERIDWLAFDTAMNIGNIKISLADCKKATPRGLQDALAGVVAKVADDVDRISRMDNSAELMDEYKRCFDVGKSVDIVNGRKLRIQAEKEREEQRKAEQERQKEAVARVDAAMPPPTVEAPVAAPVAAKPAKREPPYDIRFTIHIANAHDEEIVVPRLRELVKIMREEGVQYGK